jgi:hypothetical protein
MPKKLTTEEFIARARLVHGDRYDYSKVVYNKNNEKIIIICSIHGEFNQTPGVHSTNHGCVKCGYDSMVKNNPKNKSKILINDLGNKAKKCGICKETKELNNFYKDNTHIDNLSSTCMCCNKENGKIYRQNNRESIRERNKNYERKNKSKAKKRSKKWYSNNKIKAIKRVSKWRDDNREKYREWSRENSKKKRKECIKFRMKDSMRRLLRRCVINKTDRTHKMLGYTWDQLKGRMECQFTDEMSWENYGEWHIDHKKPVYKFDTDSSASTVNSLSNLQPLWATTREINGVIYEGNLNKGAKF